MITLSNFQDILSSAALKSLVPNRQVKGQDQQLLDWATRLYSQTEAHQYEQLEKILIELRLAGLDDKQRLKLTNTVIAASDRVITTLRQYYIYDVGALTDEQLGYVAQVESLYYLSILVYDGIIQRELSLPDKKLGRSSTNGWQRYFGSTKSPAMTSASAIYQALLTYQKLLIEKAICYQKPSPNLWLAINQLYYVACQQDVAHTDLSSYIMTRHAQNIHRLYCQICLHSLLNVRAMSRSNILSVQRLLPMWTDCIVATREPQTETRIFVDLHSDHPPTYLTASSTINPYEEQHDCLFIELAPLTAYLHALRQALADEGHEAVERYLIDKIWMAITYRYIYPQRTVLTEHSPKQQASVITGFNNIHYHISGSQSLMSLIAIKELPKQQRPRYDTQPKNQTTNHILKAEVFDNKDTTSHFRTLRLRPESTPLPDNDDDLSTTTAPPLLQSMSLFLSYYSNTNANPVWSIGVVRWHDLSTQNTEVAWQVLGHKLMACAVRLEERGARGQHFVPAIIISPDEQLQTISSLLVSTSHFQTNDRVVMRINNEQKPLRLLRSLLSTDAFSQYEVVQL